MIETRTSKSVVAIRHVHFEDLGHFTPVLERQQYNVTYYDAGIDSLESLNPLVADLLVVLGGPIGAYEEENYPFLSEELALLTSVPGLNGKKNLVLSEWNSGQKCPSNTTG